jgi:hypothetical protein
MIEPSSMMGQSASGGEPIHRPDLETPGPDSGIVPGHDTGFVHGARSVDTNSGDVRVTIDRAGDSQVPGGPHLGEVSEMLALKNSLSARLISGGCAARLRNTS